MAEVEDRTKMRPSETLADFEKRLKAIGKKPLVLAIDDDDYPAYAERIRRQSIAVSRSQGDQDIDDFSEGVIDDTMADEPPYGDGK